MAAKRPRLVPIFNQVVRSCLPATDNYWADFRTALSDSALRAQITKVAAGAPGNVSLLRRVDVVLWMAGSRSLREG